MRVRYAPRPASAAVTGCTQQTRTGVEPPHGQDQERVSLWVPGPLPSPPHLPGLHSHFLAASGCGISVRDVTDLPFFTFSLIQPFPG